MAEKKPCPSCGHCPTCGHTPYKAIWIDPRYYPHTMYPWYGTTSPNITYTTSSGTGV